MADVLDELFYAGAIPPEVYDELTNGKDPDHDYERPGELHEDIAEHVGRADLADR